MSDVSTNNMDPPPDVVNVDDPQVTIEQLQQTLTKQAEEIKGFDQKRSFFMSIYKKKEEEASQCTNELKVVKHDNQRLANDIKAIRQQQADMKTEHAIQIMHKDDVIQNMKRSHNEELASLNNTIQGLLNDVDRSRAMETKIQSLEGELRIVKTSLQGRLEKDDQQARRYLSGNQEQSNVVCALATCREQKHNLQLQLNSAHQKLQLAADSSSTGKSFWRSRNAPAPPAAPEKDLFDVGDQIRDMEEKNRHLSSAIKDLESYSSVLQVQKDRANKEMYQLRDELKETISLLDRERKEHSSLLKTWQMANDQFLESQRLMNADLERYRAVLTEEQRDKVQGLELADAERETQQTRIDDLKRQRQEEVERLEHEGIQLLEDYSIVRTESKTSLTVTPDDYGDFQGAEHIELQTNGATDTHTQITNHLTADMQQALDAPDHEALEVSRQFDTIKHSHVETTPSGVRPVSNEQWLKMQQELENARRNINKPCENCGKYEKQLNLEKSRYQKLDESYKSAQSQINTGHKTISELESQLQKLNHTCQKQVKELEEKAQKTAEELFIINQQLSSAVDEYQARHASLKMERDEVYKKLQSIQSENEKLMDLHGKTSEQLLHERNTLQYPDNIQELHSLLDKTQEELISARVGAIHKTDKLQAKLDELNDHSLAEEIGRKTLAQDMNTKISQLQDKNVRLESIISEMTRESNVQRDLKSKLEVNQTEVEKFRQTEKQLRSQIHELVNDLTESRSKITQLTDQIRNLRRDLTDSEQVQKDFVSLSQTLQMQLESIRQSDNEVRFEFQEDSTKCRSCEKQLATLKEKHNCMHCGKVHCSDCTSHRIPTGPKRRPARVCNVCHTILDNEAAPYFSSENNSNVSH